MSDHDYNYAIFEMAKEGGVTHGFANAAPRASTRAPDFPLEELETGETVHLKDLWANDMLVIEFGSFT